MRVIYAVEQNGNLRWYRHDGWGDGGDNWTAGGGNQAGNSWKVSQIFVA